MLYSIWMVSIANVSIRIKDVRTTEQCSFQPQLKRRTIAIHHSASQISKHISSKYMRVICLHRRIIMHACIHVINSNQSFHDHEQAAHHDQ